MKIPEKIVETVVKEASLQMDDPNYSAVLVSGFVRAQARISQYVSAIAEELGGAEEAVNAIFHMALIDKCFQRKNNQSIGEIDFDVLDKVSEGDRAERLERMQPAILQYVQTNIENKKIAETVMLTALAMDFMS